MKGVNEEMCILRYVIYIGMLVNEVCVQPINWILIVHSKSIVSFITKRSSVFGSL